MRFPILDFNFIKLEDSIIYCVFSQNFIKNYKLKLKLLVKTYSFDLNNVSFLNKLNKLIFCWSTNYNYMDSVFDVWTSLDVYVYKLLWVCVKRRHPRRPKTWIFLKYWKLFSGIYRFYIFNYLVGSFSILRSHFYLDVYVSRLPLSLNFYNFPNQNKFNFFNFNKFKCSFTGMFKFLWLKQLGICLICNRTFDSLDFNSIKITIFNRKRNNFSNYFLVHSYCCF